MTKIPMRSLNMTGAGPTGSKACSQRPPRLTTWPAERRSSQKEQVIPGDTTDISYEDKDDRWHDEVSAGDDRPETDVEG